MASWAAASSGLLILLALERLAMIGVDSGEVDAQIRRVGESMSTDGTGEWLLARVCPAVTRQEPTTRESTSTVDTTKGHRMGRLVQSGHTNGQTGG